MSQRGRGGRGRYANAQLGKPYNFPGENTETKKWVPPRPMKGTGEETQDRNDDTHRLIFNSAVNTAPVKPRQQPTMTKFPNKVVLDFDAKEKVNAESNASTVDESFPKGIAKPSTQTVSVESGEWCGTEKLLDYKAPFSQIDVVSSDNHDYIADFTAKDPEFKSFYEKMIENVDESNRDTLSVRCNEIFDLFKYSLESDKKAISRILQIISTFLPKFGVSQGDVTLFLKYYTKFVDQIIEENRIRVLGGKSFDLRRPISIDESSSDDDEFVYEPTKDPKKNIEKMIQIGGNAQEFFEKRGHFPKMTMRKAPETSTSDATTSTPNRPPNVYPSDSYSAGDSARLQAYLAWAYPSKEKTETARGVKRQIDEEEEEEDDVESDGEVTTHDATALIYSCVTLLNNLTDTNSQHIGQHCRRLKNSRKS